MPISKLFLSAAALVAASTVVHATAGTWNVDADGTWSTTSNWLGGTVAGGSTATDTANFTNDITATRTVTVSGTQIIGNIVFSDNGLAGSAWTVSGGTLQLGDNSTTALTPTITTTTNATIASIIAGNDGLTKAGAGTLTLTAANTYTGNTAVNAGTLQIGDGVGSTNWTYAGLFSGAGTLAIATGSNLTINGTNNQLSRTAGASLAISGTLTIGGGTAHSMDATGTITLNNGTMTTSGTGNSTFGSFFFNANRTITANGANNLISGVNTIYDGATITLNTSLATDMLTVSTNIFGTGTVVKTGAGTVTFTRANTYSGTTTINGGTLNLDFSATGAPSTNILGAGAGALTLGGGSLTLVGKASTTNSQTINGLTLAAGTGSSVTLNANATANPLLLTLGAITRNVGSSVDFTLPAGTQSATNGIVTTSGSASAIFTDATTGAAYATIGGNDWAAKAASGNNIVGLSTLGGYTGFTAGSVTLSGNADLTGSAGTYTLAGASTPATIRSLVSGNTVALNGNTLATRGILANADLTISGATGSLTAATSGGELVLNQSANTMTVSADIANNGTASSLTKAGAGTLILSGAKSYTGKTYLGAGVTQISADNNLGVAPGAAVADQLTFGGGTLKFGAATTLVANRGITLNGGGGTFDTNGFDSTVAGIVAGTGSLTKTGAGKLTLSNTSKTYGGGTTINDGTLEYNCAVAAFSLGNNVVNAAGALNLSATSMGVDGNYVNTAATLSGAGTINKVGAGYLDLFSTVNTSGFTGQLNVVTGILGSNGGLALDNAKVNVANGAAYDLRTGNSTFGELSGGATARIGRTYNNGLVTLSVGNLNTNSTFNGVIEDGLNYTGLTGLNGGTGSNALALTKTGTGTLTLTGANTYTGGTSITGGTLQLGNGSTNGTFTGTYAVGAGTTLYLNYATAVAPTWANVSGAGTLRLNSAQAVNGSANWGSVALGSGFTGTLQVDNGRINGATAGFGGATSVVLNNGSQFLAYDGTTNGTAYTFNQNFSINGMGWGESGMNKGTLRVAGMAANFAGNISLTGNSGIFTQSGVSNSSINVSGVISGGFGLSLDAPVGSITLSGVNTFSGGTTITAGTVVLASTGSIKVGANGVNLTTSGSKLTVNGTLVLTADNATILTVAGSTVDGTTGIIDLGGLFNGFNGGASGSYNLITGAGTKSGTFSILGGSYDTNIWSSVTYDGAGSLVFTAVPEPSTYGLIGAGALAGVAFVRRRRRQAGKIAA